MQFFFQEMEETKEGFLEKVIFEQDSHLWRSKVNTLVNVSS